MMLSMMLSIMRQPRDSALLFLSPAPFLEAPLTLPYYRPPMWALTEIAETCINLFSE